MSRDSSFFSPPTIPPAPSDAMMQLAGHRCLRLLGEGGMGQVFCAEEPPPTARRVALKLIRPALATHPSARARFLREMKTLAGLSHQHVVPVYRAGEAAGTLYFTMELLRGMSLAEVLRHSGGFIADLGTVVRIGRQLSDGLAAIHEAGVLHRDLKPSNVFLRTPGADNDLEEALLRGWVMLLDFGLALGDGAERLTDEHARPGTPGYLAPEAPAFSRRSDLYAVGVTLYQMLCGELPSPDQSLERHRALPAVTPTRLVRLVERLISSDVQSRFATATELAQEFDLIEQEFVCYRERTPGEVDLRLTVRRLVGGVPAEVLVSTAGVIPAATRNMRLLPASRPAPALRTSDAVRIQVSANTPGYVTVFNIGPTGDLTVLYPECPLDEQPRPAGANEVVQVLDVELTPPHGRERLYAAWQDGRRGLTEAQLRDLVRQGELPAPGTTRNLKRLARLIEEQPQDIHLVAIELDHQEAPAAR